MAGSVLQPLLFVRAEGLGDVFAGADGYQGLAVHANRGRPLQSPSPVLGFLPVPSWTSFPCGKTNTRYSVRSSSSIKASTLGTTYQRVSIEPTRSPPTVRTGECP